MKNVHLVIPDLFLPEGVATEVCADLRLAALEKILARGSSTSTNPSTKPLVLSGVEGSGRTGEGGYLENHLCELFGVTCTEDAQIAPISASFDGLAEGCWLRADPVHLHLQRDQLLLAGVQPGGEEAAAFCESLNEHFAGQGMEFFAPHPQRWYVRLDALPRIRTTPLSAVLGCNVRRALPTGEDAAHWHRLFNEIQMLLFAHPLNEAREARSELTVNSVWLWGGGCNSNSGTTAAPANVSSDDVLSEMFAVAAGVPFSAWTKRWNMEAGDGKQLLVWTGLRSALQRGDLADWRAALQDFETGYAQPLWQALRSGKIGQLELDILGEHGIRRVRLTRGDTLAFWRRTRRLAEYSLT